MRSPSVRELGRWLGLQRGRRYSHSVSSAQQVTIWPTERWQSRSLVSLHTIRNDQVHSSFWWCSKRYRQGGNRYDLRELFFIQGCTDMVVLIKASSTGLLLKTTGLKVTSIKIDPYMNIDAGTMAPTEHGEVYVLNDGGEVDLDLGNYERYLNVTLSRDNNLTTGKIYREVIEKEIIPHITTAIQDWIERVSKVPVDDTGEEPDVCIVELGGTVGDIESAPFIEAMRQFQFRVGHANFALIHVSLVPDMHGEQKTKPTQATIRDLRGLGLLPDLVRLRCPSVKCIESGIIQFLQKRLDLLSVRIPPALVEKGHDLANRWKILTQTGILVPGGFGSRGTEGMVLAIKWAREQKVPFLGICLGFQMAVVEWARNILGLQNACSAEIDETTPHPVIVYMPEISKTHLGGTMRLGLRPTLFNQDSASWSRARALYGGADTIWERHRHRYEVGPAYVDRIAESGLEFIGKDEAGVRMQILELRDHPYFVGLQAHPEFCTRPLNPSPPFLGLVAAASGKEVLREQIQNQRNYVSPHPVSAQVLEYTPTVREAGCNIGGSETPRVIQD
ncbi:CTP synthase [Rhizoctonia solani AG-1 IA]|uniref:CTP synthase n=1 Tax=Thanatephorus cucumeris (strain AG1-IA) TaxID=983506 RepID=L8X038_THACA|nr:CTP synthase [Rhizoctonia solani AG-1 IA]